MLLSVSKSLFLLLKKGLKQVKFKVHLSLKYNMKAWFTTNFLLHYYTYKMNYIFMNYKRYSSKRTKEIIGFMTCFTLVLIILRSLMKYDLTFQTLLKDKYLYGYQDMYTHIIMSNTIDQTWRHTNRRCVRRFAHRNENCLKKHFLFVKHI